MLPHLQHIMDEAETARLLDQLGGAAAEHPDAEMRTAYHLVLATVQTRPAASINQVKAHIQASLGGAQPVRL